MLSGALAVHAAGRLFRGPQDEIVKGYTSLKTYSLHLNFPVWYFI